MFTLNNSVLKSSLEKHRLSKTLSDIESLELHFLTLESVNISFNDEHFIAKLSYSKPPFPASPVATTSYPADTASRIPTAPSVSMTASAEGNLNDFFWDGM